ncbi:MULTISPECIES: magnesium transporter CorA family protein [Cytobacillus]|uniref:Magnesium transporter CorA family protein n=1 Tax=Cytobacillus stercorigallinarum TaxID=2762240 RepID=A0ABR8QTC6_9BACI|nr:magnesium transporter CorA family protein [Cytobacillus stercorigallinarum]MBD7938512.1 magnesium transporter CorA family protein [Cytobacillus stercorigallinarum]
MKIKELNNWQWFNDFKPEANNYQEFPLYYKEEIELWVKNISSQESNHLHLQSTEGKAFICGSLIYEQKLNQQSEYKLLHYFLTEHLLITSEFEQESHINDMKEAENAVAVFSILLAEILKNSIKRIDDFELKLNKVLWEIKQKNSIARLEEIFQLRHEVLVWKNFMIPITELSLGLEETFSSDIVETKHFKNMRKRLERGSMLTREYIEEIDHLVHFEEMVSSHRGNEVIKTLTVITTLFTPISAWGALWGMNFKFMPELDEKWGYTGALIIIILSTVAVYLLLVKRGWTGDTLRSRKKNSFFK